MTKGTENAIANIQKYVRGANYLPVAQIYPQDNCLLKRPPEAEDIWPYLASAGLYTIGYCAAFWRSRADKIALAVIVWNTTLTPFKFVLRYTK